MDSGYRQDGFKALVTLSGRFDSKNAATLMQAFLEVVIPPPMENVGDTVSEVHRWEARVAALWIRYQEELNDQMKLAILIGMLPREYQDMKVQT